MAERTVSELAFEEYLSKRGIVPRYEELPNGKGDVVGQLDLLTHISHVTEKDPWNEVDPKCHVKLG